MNRSVPFLVGFSEPCHPSPSVELQYDPVSKVNRIISRAETIPATTMALGTLITDTVEAKDQSEITNDQDAQWMGGSIAASQMGTLMTKSEENQDQSEVTDEAMFGTRKTGAGEQSDISLEL
jgi:hypothetical protein